MANPMYGQNKADDNIDSVSSNLLDYLSGYQGNLLLNGITIDETASAAVVAGGASAAEIIATRLAPNCVN